MSRHEPRIKRCLKKFGLFYRRLSARIVIQGKSGRVVSARVLGRYRGAPVAHCVQRRLRRVRFPRFRQSRQRVTLSFVTRDE
jgi:hypothetical protein